MEKEKSLMELLLIEAKAVDVSASRESSTFRVLMEQERFRQDCRKRAMDLAYSRIPYVKNEGEWSPSNEQIVELANQHYQWLISIPNSD